jgi:aryl-alcohol dehydrogenase-like predicted oxidoreductase
MAPIFPQRKIGETPVSAMGFGAMRLSFPVGDVDDDNALRVLTRAADMGITFWDTADMYGPFTNEALIGRWFRETGRRDEIFLCTKFGMKVIDGKPTLDGSAEYVEEACGASLERLGTTYIDLYYVQRVDSSTPIEITVGAMKKLKDGGKITGGGYEQIGINSQHEN